ncbi:MAG TPA: hypothetical protein DCM73_04365 [Clostridiales bacterium]|nr:hypothetical protein [Clostridiales bacterium]
MNDLELLERDLFLNGTLCEVCGKLMPDLVPEDGRILNTPPGHRRRCDDCYGETRQLIMNNKKIP